MESLNYVQDGRMQQQQQQQQQQQITITNLSSIPSTSGQTVVIIETKALPEIPEKELNNEVCQEFTEEESSSDEQSESVKTKGKRTRNPDKWQANIRKRQRQRGENYTDRSGQEHRARKVGAGCGSSCRLRCEKLLSPEDRQRVFDQFWALDDQQKWQFYAIYVERWQKARQRTKVVEPATNSNPRKKYSYVYFLQNRGGGRVRVCKTFFLSTLDISQKRLYFFYENVRTESGLPRAPMRGKVGSRATPESRLQQIRDHIRAFTRVPPPPGMTPAPGEEFLDAGISVRRMYELYKEAYGTLAVKENVYRKVLKSDFTIKFIKPPNVSSS